MKVLVTLQIVVKDKNIKESTFNPLLKYIIIITYILVAVGTLA